MSYILSHSLKHFINSQPCQRGVLLGLLLSVISPLLSNLALVESAKGQAEEADVVVNAIYLPFVFHNATLTDLAPMPTLTPIETAFPADTLPSTVILPTMTPTPNIPLLETFEPTAAPTLVDAPTSAGTVPATPMGTQTTTVVPTTLTTPLPTATPVNTLLPTAMPTVSNTPAPTATQNATPTTTAMPTPEVPTTPTVTATSGSGGATILYTSSNGNGTIGSVAFNDEDIIAYNMTTGVWALLFDGSDVGVITDVDALHVENDGSLLLSFFTTTNIAGFGAVEGQDIVRFTPTSLGATTAGSFTWFFDGSDVGLDTDAEDIDTLTRLPDGRLVIGSAGLFNAGGVSGIEHDLFLFTPTSLGETTSGSWQLYFDGADAGLSGTNEDLWGVELASNGGLYLNTIHSYAVPGLSGDSDDILLCTPGTLGDTTTCTYSLYWNGDSYGVGGYWFDALAISDVTLVGSANAERTAVETAASRSQLYLPIANR